jgi:endo-1,3(4)-beta-glucanase
LLFACAVLGSLDPSFVEYANSCDAIFYDIAHNCNFEAKPAAVGPFFPGARHKVWFDGHSFASGMFPFGNGKSQESSSEAVNGYFGAYLWSVVRNGAIDDPSKDESPQTDFARLLLAMEIQGARMYWQMSPEANPSSVSEDSVSPYTAQFRRNYMVGNLGMLDALCSTWFGDEELYIHMINLLPVTAATAELFHPDYAAQEYDKKLRPLGEVEMAWRGYVIADQAIVDPNSAWVSAERLFSPTLDSGLSKSQVYFWISTRPGFNASERAPDPVPSEKHSSRDQLSSRNHDENELNKASCANQPACVKTMLVGDCCPTLSGIFLDCCSQRDGSL